MPSIDVHVPHSVAARTMRANLLAMHWDVPRGSHVRLHFGERWQHVCPWFIAAVGVWARHMRRELGVTFEVVNGDRKSAAYMWRMRLHSYLGIEPVNLPVEHEETGRFIALREVRTPADILAATEDVLPLVHGAGREEWLGAIKHIYTELLRNVLEHAQSSEGALICAQWYPTGKYVQIGVADAGRGVRASLEETHAVDSDASALVLALRPGVTGTAQNPYGGQRNAGVGLAMTRRLAEASQRYFAIASGRAAFVSYVGSRSFADAERVVTVPHFPGTMVCAELQLAEEIESDDAIRAARDSILPLLGAPAIEDRIRFT